MKIACIALVAVIGLGSVVLDAHPPTIVSADAERRIGEEITAFRKELADAIAAKDEAKVRRMYAPSFVHTHGSGKIDGKDARIASALAGDPLIETAVVEDLVVRAPNDWVAIATGVSPIRLLGNGKTHKLRWTAVYVRTNESWQLAASHETRLAGDEP